MHAAPPSMVRASWLRGGTVAPSDLSSLRDWFPVAIDDDGVVWRHIPAQFSEPFFFDTLETQARELRRVCRTPHDWPVDTGPALAPSAFIFHVSRCGSTLLTQLLASLPQCVVHSEPPVLDDFFRRLALLPASQHVPALQALLASLGQRRHGATHYIVKLDCWQIDHLALLRQAFPATPCWFLYREPLAVLASHRRQRGLQMVPGMVYPTSFAPDVLAGDLDGWCARVVAHLMQTALKHARDLRLINYEQLPGVLPNALLSALGITPTPEQRQALMARASYHAKQGGAHFTGDPASDVTTAPHLVEVLAPLYAQLEALRMGELS